MKYEKIENGGRETAIVLFVLIPHCKACRDRIERTILDMGCFERVDFGYPSGEGSPVSLVYAPEKYPDVDFWQKASEVKKQLDFLGYRVL